MNLPHISVTLLLIAGTAFAQLSPLEQIPVATFEKMKEVERYQMRIAEKHYTNGEFKTSLAEYEKFLTLYEKSPGAPYAQLMWSHSMMRLKKPKTALREGFQSVIDYWPESEEAVIAAYCIADAYRTMGEVADAKKAFRFLINGQTGEVSGESPKSWWKIGFLVAGVLLVLFLILLAGGRR